MRQRLLAALRHHHIVFHEVAERFCADFLAGRHAMAVGDGDFAFSRALLECRSMRQGLVGSYSTSVLPARADVVQRYNSNCSPILRTLEFFDACGAEYNFGVDATRLNETAVWKNQAQCEVVIWTYPFPECNDDGGTLVSKRDLMKRFFRAVGSWQCFAPNGTVVLGLKSTSTTPRHEIDDEDYQLTHWELDQIAVDNGFRLQPEMTSKPMAPFWRPTRNFGRPMCRQRELALGRIKVKFYVFLQN